MPLPMTRPWKHPKTGIYWLRKRVPDDLRDLVGKREEKRSLKTKDAAEAKKFLFQALSELEVRWANLRRGPSVLSESEAHEIASPVHDWWIKTHKDNPSEQVHWSTNIGAQLWSPLRPIDSSLSLQESVSADLAEQLKRDPLENWSRDQADELLKARGLVVDDNSRLKLAKAVAAAMQRASLALEQLAFGYQLQPQSFNGFETMATKSEKSVSLDLLVEGWSRERSPAKKTFYEWTRVIKELKDYLGHDDATRITPSHPAVGSRQRPAANECSCPCYYRRENQCDGTEAELY